MPEMRPILSELKCKPETHSYLADGVYIGHDGYQIWLTAERDGMVHKIALDADTLAALYRYAQQFMKGPMP
jgi:hypothetical protein